MAKGKSIPLGRKEETGKRTKFLGLDLSTRSLTALGAAVRAAVGFPGARGDRKTWREPAERLIRTKETKSVLPRKEAVRIYRGENGLLKVYQTCETSASPEGEINRFRSAFSAG